MKKLAASTFSHSINVLLALAIILGLVGCATTMQTRSAKPSGFLKDYSKLRKGRGAEAQLIYISPEADFSAYDKVMIDPVTIWTEGDSKMSKMPREDLQELADYLFVALKTQLEQDYTIVERPGPGVLHVKAAITDAKGSKVVMDVISSAVPQLRTLTTVTKLAADTHLVVGKAAAEAEILDSLSGERLMAAVDERAGAKALRGAFGTWNDVKEAYDYWANRLRVRLAELRAK